MPALTPEYILHWDGSFSSQGAGIGGTIVCGGHLTCTFSVPVRTSDACRTEALGPVLLALIVSLMPTGMYHFYGDSQVVVGLLAKSRVFTDV